MAYGDFLDLKQRACRSAQFNPSSTEDLDLAGDAINEALSYVHAQSISWDFAQAEGSITLTVGTTDYTYATIKSAIGDTYDIEEVLSIVNDTDGGSLLEGMSWAALESYAESTNDGDPAGWPYYFAQYDRTVRLYPSPDTAYVLRLLYKRRNATLSLDADTPLMPLGYRHSVLVPYAAAILLEQEGGGEAMNDYERRMNRFEKAYLELRAAHGSARAPSFRLQTPGFTKDLPGSRGPFGWTE